MRRVQAFRVADRSAPLYRRAASAWRNRQQPLSCLPYWFRIVGMNAGRCVERISWLQVNLRLDQTGAHGHRTCPKTEADPITVCARNLMRRINRAVEARRT